MESILCSRTERISIVKMATVPKAVYKLNVTSIIVLMTAFKEIRVNMADVTLSFWNISNTMGQDSAKSPETPIKWQPDSMTWMRKWKAASFPVVLIVWETPDPWFSIHSQLWALPVCLTEEMPVSKLLSVSKNFAIGTLQYLLPGSATHILPLPPVACDNNKRQEIRWKWR